MDTVTIALEDFDKMRNHIKELEEENKNLKDNSKCMIKTITQIKGYYKDEYLNEPKKIGESISFEGFEDIKAEAEEYYKKKLENEILQAKAIQRQYNKSYVEIENIVSNKFSEQLKNERLQKETSFHNYISTLSSIGNALEEQIKCLISIKRSANEHLFVHNNEIRQLEIAIESLQKIKVKYKLYK